MLETIREFAAERLEESGEADEILHRLAVKLLALGESARPDRESEPASVRRSFGRSWTTSAGRSTGRGARSGARLPARGEPRALLGAARSVRGGAQARASPRDRRRGPAVLRARALRTLAEAATWRATSKRARVPWRRASPSSSESATNGRSHRAPPSQHHGARRGRPASCRQLVEASLATSVDCSDRSWRPTACAAARGSSTRMATSGARWS